MKKTDPKTESKILALGDRGLSDRAIAQALGAGGALSLHGCPHPPRRTRATADELAGRSGRCRAARRGRCARRHT